VPDAQGAMPHGAIGRGGESGCKTTICFGNDKQTLFIGRSVEAESRHASKSQPHTEDLTRAEV
jgi:hypothetical protein